MTETGGDFAVVFRGLAPEANLVKGLLESHDVPAFLRDENVSTLLPLTGMPAGFGMVTVVVSRSDSEKAKRLLA